MAAMVPVEVEQWHTSIRALLTEVTRRASEGVRGYCDRNSYAYISRVKKVESLAEKLETGRVAALSEIDDLFACCIIIPSLASEAPVIRDLEAMFHAVALKRRESTFKNPDVFRFEATRFIGRLRTSDIDDPRFGQLSFEVQIRTAFEHAWSVATHGEAYKGDRVDWKLERLAAQMKALVEQLDVLAVAYEQSAGSIIEHPCERTACESYALEKLTELCVTLPIPEECTPDGWGLFAKNIVGLADAAAWSRWFPLQTRVEKIVLAAIEEAQGLGTERYPRSLSLFQFVLGAAVERGVIPTRFRRDDYCLPISAALEMIFPRTQQIAIRCNLENAAIPEAEEPPGP